MVLCEGEPRASHMLLFTLLSPLRRGGPTVYVDEPSI